MKEHVIPLITDRGSYHSEYIKADLFIALEHSPFSFLYASVRASMKWTNGARRRQCCEFKPVFRLIWQRRIEAETHSLSATQLEKADVFFSSSVITVQLELG